jgi:hypothetical protein
MAPTARPQMSRFGTKCPCFTLGRGQTGPAPDLLVTAKFLAAIVLASSCLGTESANLMDSWRLQVRRLSDRCVQAAWRSARRQVPARSTHWSEHWHRRAMPGEPECGPRACRRTVTKDPEEKLDWVRSARVPANVQVCTGAPSERDITKFVPEDVGIFSASVCSATQARRDKATVGEMPFASTERMPWHTSRPRLRAPPIHRALPPSRTVRCSQAAKFTKSEADYKTWPSRNCMAYLSVHAPAWCALCKRHSLPGGHIAGS